MTKSDEIKIVAKNYDSLVSQISETSIQGKQNAINVVKSELVNTYWKVEEHIIEFEQNGKARAEYGSALLEHLSKDLALIHEKGFSLSNVKRMKQFYNEYSNSATLSHYLSWSHYVNTP